MSVRIRYDENEDGTMLTSRRVFTTGAGVQVKVMLDFNHMSFSVVKAAGQEVVEISAPQITRNKNVLKIKAKECLEKLGVEFTEESRDVESKKDAAVAANDQARQHYDSQNRGE